MNSEELREKKEFMVTMMMVASVIVLLSMGVSEAFLKLHEHPVVRFHKSSCNIATSPHTVEDSVDIEV